MCTLDVALNRQPHSARAVVRHAGLASYRRLVDSQERRTSLPTESLPVDLPSTDGGCLTQRSSCATAHHDAQPCGAACDLYSQRGDPTVCSLRGYVDHPIESASDRACTSARRAHTHSEGAHRRTLGRREQNGIGLRRTDRCYQWHPTYLASRRIGRQQCRLQRRRRSWRIRWAQRGYRSGQ